MALDPTKLKGVLRVGLKKADDLPEAPVAKAKKDFEDKAFFKRRKEADYHNIQTGEYMGRLSAGEARDLAKHAGWKQSQLRATNQSTPARKPTKEVEIPQGIDNLDDLTDEQLLWLYKRFQQQQGK